MASASDLRGEVWELNCGWLVDCEDKEQNGARNNCRFQQCTSYIPTQHYHHMRLSTAANERGRWHLLYPDAVGEEAGGQELMRDGDDWGSREERKDKGRKEAVGAPNEK